MMRTSSCGFPIRAPIRALNTTCTAILPSTNVPRPLRLNLPTPGVSVRSHSSAAVTSRSGDCSPSNSSNDSCHRAQGHALSRRAMLLGTALAVALPSSKASAGLIQFPINELNNRYFLVRAGQSYAEQDDTIFRNPVWKTSQRSGLSPTGVQQVVKVTLPALQQVDACVDGCWLWPSIWQSSYMTAEILASQLAIGRSRIVPEYSFLDARGLGDYEGGRVNVVEEQVAAADAQDPLWKPPKGTDGTPNESVNDVLVRMRQVMSICETQYSNEDILLIAPDSDTLSILQAAVLGVDLRSHPKFALPLGAVRPLALSTRSFDTEPRQFRCTNPPSCR